MRWQMKLLTKLIVMTLITALAGITFLAHHFSNQSDIFEENMKRLNGYWQIGKPATLMRNTSEGKLGGSSKKEAENQTRTQKVVKSEAEVLIYLQVKERLADKQKIRIFVLIQNGSWIKKLILNEPDIQIIEKFETVPSNEQISNMIFKSKNPSNNLKSFALWPMQSYVAHADFELPFPSSTDINVYSFLFENGLEQSDVKQITDNVLVRKSDLNAMSVQ